MQPGKLEFCSVLSSKIHFWKVFSFPIQDPDLLSYLLCFCLKTAADLFLSELFHKSLVVCPMSSTNC